MNVRQIFQSSKTAVSFEFFPPKNENASRSLFETIKSLIQIQPAYVSVTYGAGGSTRHLTHDLVVKIQQETNLTVVSHLTCVGSTKEEIHSILQKYHDSGIRNIMALRGDPPKGESLFTPVQNGFNYAWELVAFIKKHFPDMGIGVAGFPEGHPESNNRLTEIANLKQKVDAGADYICTQLFLDNRDFYDFCERCELAGIHVPIVAGIMPIVSLKSMNRMAELSARSRFPAKLLRLLYRAGTEENVERAGLHWAAEQVRDLLDHKVRGIHFYTLNRSEQVHKICEALGINNSLQLQ
ncbi:MAG: methylenetetrahydrofolate reductase [NAD(P)H] [Candidatus Brocadiae bacterium]|nr:methylenetetrahydrofolate reductase [NAD(P)H] [Candidatus Brocadiia bacterium]